MIVFINPIRFLILQQGIKRMAKKRSTHKRNTSRKGKRKSIRASTMFAIRQSIGLKYLLSGSWNIVRPVYRVVHSKRYP
jgi:hypothetical protein